MTPTRYFFARAAQPFGFIRRNQRMADAAAEMRLLREAEAHLGTLVWERVVEIEDLSVEYWNLRRLVKQRGALMGDIEQCEARLNQAHEQRANLLAPAESSQHHLIEERETVLTKLTALARRRDEVIASARSIRRTYEGLKMKQEVLTKESDASPAPDAELPKVKARLAELKVQFVELKEERIRVGNEIEHNDAKLDAIDAQLNSRRKVNRAEASEAFQAIGETNKEISTLRAEVGLLENQMRALQAEVGRHISRQAGVDPACTAACKEFNGLIAVMRALRQSIALNHKLAGMD